jgi:4-cresol dehydrogenase (hydroxylating) flavoprotein subunit
VRSTTDACVTAEALVALVAVVGAEWVETDAAELDRVNTATFPTRWRAAAVVRPASVEEVRGCVRAAAEHGLALYPVSRGKNWGYGSRAPGSDGALLLSLERLDRIVDFDERLGYATIEPGVTFRQLAEFLAARGSRLYLNAPGSTPEASVVGNALERGTVQGAAPDRAAEVCAPRAWRRSRAAAPRRSTGGAWAPRSTGSSFSPASASSPA